MTTTTSRRRHPRIGGLLLAACTLLASSCGSSDDAAAPAAGADDETEIQASTESTEAPASGDPSNPFGGEGGRIDVGGVYEDAEHRATYLGIAEVPVGPDIFTGGRCFTLLFDAVNLDPFDFGANEFSPSSDLYLVDGTTAENDSTGVGCDMKPLTDAGFERLISTRVEPGESARGFLGAFHVPDGAAELDVATIYGSEPSYGGFIPTITESFTG